MREPPRHRLRPGGTAVRTGQGVCQPPRAVRHRHLQGVGHLDQAQGHRHRRVFGRQLHRRPGLRRHRAARSVGRRLQEARAGRRTSGRRLPVWRHGGRRLVLPADQGRPGHPRRARPPDVRPEPSGRRRTQGPDPGRLDARHGRGVRLQRRVQGHHRQGDQGKGPVFAGRRAQAHQGIQFLRFMHRPGRTDPRLVHRWRLHAGQLHVEGDVRLYRHEPWRCACGDPRPPLHRHPDGDARTAVEDAEWLRQLPPGAQLLRAVELAARGEGRSAEPLHQRTGARQHPEGRHLFGGAAHVGRPDHAERTARHRRCGREIPGADGQGDRRPAHRPAGREEGRPACDVGRPVAGRHGVRPRLRQEPAHREDLRRRRALPLRHPAVDGVWA
jgi:hypothetical protein